MSLLNEWKYLTIGGLTLLSVVLGYGWKHSSELRAAEKKVCQATIESYKQAQVFAEERIKTETERLRKEGEDRANEADKKYSELLATYRASILRYQANQSVPRRAGDSTASNPPAITYEPRESPKLSGSTLTITLDDAQICAENTARLQSAHEWALSLKEQ